MYRMIRFIALPLLVLLLLAACGAAGEPTGAGGQDSPATAASTSANAPSAAAESSITASAVASASAGGAAASTGGTTTSGAATTAGGSATFGTQPINIMAPAAPGGGWDQTARAVQPGLAAATNQNVQVYNVPGAGGTVGLAQFVNDHRGNPNQLMMTGLVMVGAIQTNNAPVDLTQATPLATLTTEWEAIVVPTNSKYQNLKELMDDFKANPSAISWGGGSAGSTDHVLVGLLAKEVGADPSKINYIAHSGGGEALSAILSGAVSAGVSGLNEVRDQVQAGQLRLLGVSSDERLEGLDAPTVTEAGYNVTLPNWRGIVAPPDISAEERAAMIAALERMHETPEWQQALEKNGWNDFFRTGDEFTSFLQEETTRLQTVLRDIGLVQ